MSVAGKKVTDYPLLKREWHSEKNAGISPNDLGAGSNKKVWWKCSAGHEFHASPNRRTNNQRSKRGVSSCPDCGGLKFWTWEKIVQIAKEVVRKEGHLPPAAKFQAAGYAMLVQCLYKQGKSWGDLQEATSSFEKSIFVQSRNGMRWRSHPEASLSNFLYARGIPHEKGRRYPKDYSRISGKASGYYDLHLISHDKSIIDVEIWGDKPNGYNEDGYALVRAGKEKYNQGRTGFLGIHYKDCFSDEMLTSILKPHIGIIEPFIFDNPHDHYIETAHWSNADELIETCRQIAIEQPNGKFPTEDWLRKRGRWKHRDGPAYNTVSVYIKLWIGGTRKLRELLGQDYASTKKWGRENAIDAYRRFYERHNITPSQMRQMRDRLDSCYSSDVIKDAANISAAVQKHVGKTKELDQLLGITVDRTRKWPKEKIIERCRYITSEYGVTPNQLRSDYASGKASISKELYKEVGQLIDAANRKFGGVKNVLSIIGFSAPSRKRIKRTAKVAR
jgi:hypothetical protein